MRLIKVFSLLLILITIPIVIFSSKEKKETRSKALIQETTSLFKKGLFSIGFKRLEIKPPFVWYWGWDDCNCQPEDLKCAYDLYKEGKVCGESNNKTFPYGPFGGYRFTWGMGAPDGLLNLLNMAKEIKIGIQDYTKPLWFSGPVFTDSQGNITVPQSLASKLYCGTENGREIYKWVAKYQNLTNNYLKWIREVAERIKNHPNFAGITITHGLDGESKCKPDQCTTTYPDGTRVDDPCQGYEEYKKTITEAYYKNFCQGTYHEETQTCDGTMKPVYLQTSSWNDAGGKLGQYNPPIGMKFSGFITDTVGIQYGGRWRGYGLIEGFARYRNLIPTAIEAKYGNWGLDNGGEAGGQGTYWWNLESLWLRPTAIDMNPSYGLRWQVSENPDYFDLINNHLNVTAQTTPDVWIALRDTPQMCGAKTAADFENNPCVKTDGVSGKVGDYDFFLRRPDGIPGNKTKVLTRPDVYKTILTDLNIEPFQLYNQEIPNEVRTHQFSRHLRRTDKVTGNYYMSFDVDNDYPWTGRKNQKFEATIYYLDLGNGPFYLEYKNSEEQIIQKEIIRQNSRTWKKAVITLENAYFNDGFEGFTDFRIYNGGINSENVYLHMIKIKGLGEKPIDYKWITNITCSLPNESVYQEDSPLLAIKLTDRQGNPLPNRNIRITIDPYWYTNRISYTQTDNNGVAKKNLDLTNLPPIFQDFRSAHEIEVVFPGDRIYRSSSALCYLPVNLKRGDIQKRTITATLSKNEVKLGDYVKVEIQTTGSGSFSVEGEGFGMPACAGQIEANGHGSCSFKIGGMAVAGRRVLGVITGWQAPYGAASINIPITVIDENEESEPPLPTELPEILEEKFLNLKVKLEGVKNKPSKDFLQKIPFKIKIGEKEFSNILGTSDDNGIWTIKIDNFDMVSEDYDIFVKGPKHLQKKFGKTKIELGKTIDLTDKELKPGDLKNSQGEQDGVVNALDAVYLVSCFSSPQERTCLEKGDLNFDGIINTIDIELLNSTINSNNWEDEK